MPSLIDEAQKHQPHSKVRVASVPVFGDACSNTRPQTARTEGPYQITYVPIPGPWRRQEKPNWPESAFQIPAEVPDGTIYYVKKGRWVGQGSTAHSQLLPSGHVVIATEAQLGQTGSRTMGPSQRDEGYRDHNIT